MKVVQIQFSPWDKIYNFDPNNLELEAGDSVVVKTELGTEIGRVVSFKEVDKKDLKAVEKKTEPAELADGVDLVEPGKEETEKEIKPVLRKATSLDLGKLVKEEDKNKAFSFCKKMIDKQGLPMKLVDVHFAFDGSRVTFAFIADGRIDFRELVKDLTRHFSKSIRLQQIGIRDEAKLMGDFGHCGRKLCCKKFLHNLESITSEMAERQQVVHRGSERISGICGRLMCCLAYEEVGYEELAKKLPPIGAKVNVDGKRGVVVGQHVLKQTVNVEFPGEKGEASSVVEVDINRDK
ncbi:MAG: regulatory iron-sulfur-containing complex subunit RicT [Patescibacteria group bacterium]